MPLAHAHDPADSARMAMNQAGLPGMDGYTDQHGGAQHSDDAPLLTGPALAALLMLPGVGVKRAIALGRRFGTWEAFLAASPDHLAGVLGAAVAMRVVEVMPSSVPEADLPEGVRVVSIYEDSYPASLRAIPDAPPLLWWQGTLPSGPTLAVVGTRTPNAFGAQVATLAASVAAGHRIGTVSGLALGVDSLAHRASMDSGAPTWAVLGQGISTLPKHGDRGELARRIVAAGGGLLSEVPPSTPVAAHMLTARNRIQSGLSAATFIAQTGLATPLKPAGTLHTARFAIEQGRLLAVAAPPTTVEPDEAMAGNAALVAPEGVDPTLLHITDPDLSATVAARQPAADKVIAHPNDLHELCAHIRASA